MSISRKEFISTFNQQIKPRYDEEFQKIRKIDGILSIIFVVSSLMLFACVIIFRESRITIYYFTFYFSVVGVVVLFDFFSRVIRKDGKSVFSYVNEREELQHQLYNECVSLIYPFFSYNQSEGVSKSEFIRYGFFRPRYASSVITQDVFTGTVNGKDMRINELSVSYTPEGENSKPVTIFEGISVEMPSTLNKDYSFVAIGNGQEYYPSHSSLLGAREVTRLDRINMNHEKFDSIFLSYTNDQSMTDALFDEEQLERIANVTMQNLDTWFHFSVSDGKIVFLFPHKQLFELYNMKSLDAEQIWNDFSVLYVILQAISEMDVNEWMYR